MRKLVFIIFFLNFFCSITWAAKTFVYCSEASPKIFNPQLATDGPTFNASSRTVYNRLVDFKSGGTEIVPSLAESWSVNKLGTIFTFHLRRDVKFQTTDFFKPTRSLNADDVLFSFDRMRLKDHPYHKVNGGLYQYFDGMDMGSLIKNISKTDDYTVVFELAHPEAPFLANLAMDFSSILSKEYGDVLLKKGTPDKIDFEPVGTGPFIFKKYVKDNLIRYSSNKNYFMGPAQIENLIFAITPDASVRFQKLKAGECHFIAEPSPADVPKIEKDGKFIVTKAPGLNIGYLAFNTKKKPLDNLLVRKAIHLALNRDAYIQAIYLGNAKKAKNPIPPTMWSYNDQIKDYEYNPTKAKELLAQAGFKKGFETEIWTLPVSRPYNPNGKRMGEMMQEDLAKVGVKVKLVTYKWAEYLNKAANGEHALLQLGWTGDNGDPDNFLNTLLGCDGIAKGSNYAQWCDKDFQNHIKKAKMTADIELREKHYKMAQEIFKANVPWVTIAHATVFKAMDKKVKGYKASPFGYESFYEVNLEK
ncbi:MAG: ABC transporter substrate-binding protein [Bdellovibrionaceae bacterium]|nr:ABC transporter substrate-binding protein [Pseudobdellovibrionaceae bacterium]